MNALSRNTMCLLVCTSLATFTLQNGRLLADTEPNRVEGFLDMPLEELMNIQVISSARREQPLVRSSAAIYVISAEDIRMAGVTKLADLFRLVPGMQVKQMRDFSFDIGIRGFAQHNAARIQILLDGVSLYDAYKGGCELEFYPIFLDDIERIEVIRGPAAVVWGVNAMNGAINIITKKAADTQGVRTYAGWASNFVSEGYIGVGGQADNVAARFTTGAFWTHGLGLNRGSEFDDSSHSYSATGRSEVTLNDGAVLTLSGGHKKTSYESPGRSRMTHPGLQYMTLSWDKKYSKDSSLKVTWAENWFQNIDNSTYDTWTRQDMLEVQNTQRLDVHQIVWGADYTRDVFHSRVTDPGGYKSISNPEGFANDQLSAFAEDEITLAENLWFTIGGRLQHNELTGQDWAGNGVLTWEAVPKHFLRAGVSRAFGRPIMQNYFYWYRSATTARTQEFPLERYSFDGMSNEHILAYQLGYRGQLSQNLDIDIEAFYHKNTDMIGSYSATVGGNSYRLTDNVLDVDSYGVETSINYKPAPWWLVRANHSYEHQTEENCMNNATQYRLKVPSVPKHTVTLTNRFYLDESTTFNTQLFYTDAYYLVNANYYAATNRVKKQVRFDVHLARKVFANAGEIAIGIKNSTDPYHWEGDSDKIPTQYYAQFRYQF